MVKVQILKQMQAGDTILKSGDIVDATGWRHLKTLESNRYIKVLSASEAPLPVNEDVATSVVEEEKPKTKTKLTKEQQWESHTQEFLLEQQRQN